MAIGIQQQIDVAVVNGDCPSGLKRTAQAAAAGQEAHRVALAVGAGLFQNRFDQDPQAKHGCQGLLQPGARSLQEHGGPANGERRGLKQGQASGLMLAD